MVYTRCPRHLRRNLHPNRHAQRHLAEADEFMTLLAMAYATVNGLVAFRVYNITHCIMRYMRLVTLHDTSA